MGKTAAYGSSSWGESLMQLENTYVMHRFVRNLAIARGRKP